MTEWVVIGACLIEGLCTLTDNSAFTSKRACEVHRAQYESERPGNIYDCEQQGRVTSDRLRELLYRGCRERGCNTAW